MRSNKILFLALLAMITVAFSACNNDDDQPAAENKEMVSFEFNYVVNGEAYDTSKVYTINGTAVKFSIANFYLGGINFMSEDGAATEMEDKYLLITPDAGMQEVGELQEGQYPMVSFFIGVDSVANGQTEEDFTTRSEDPNDPLGLQFPQMHWSWNNGYKFIRVDGKVDTDGDGVPDEVMSFHLGNNGFVSMVKTLEFAAQKQLEEGAGNMYFEFDLAKALEGIDLVQDHFNHALTAQEIPLATQFRDNLGGAFQYTDQ